MKNNVLLGMSGGIDSSVSVMLLQDKGYSVVGITFVFSGLDNENDIIIGEAKKIASKLAIKHIVVDLRKEFSNTVIKYFTTEYNSGKTPFPCAFCNPKIKFYYLQKYAQIEKCDFISTGHYVKTGLFNGKKYLFQGVDPDKDQSFFLWGLKEELIDKLIFPLGKYKKSEIKDIAIKRGFNTLSRKKESLGICFIEGNNYRKFLETEGIFSLPGNFVDEKGYVLGKHKGITNYTIGQRRGLGINLNFPVFVSEIRVKANEIVLGKYDDLYRSTIVINNYHILDKQDVNNSKGLTVKVRYRLQETPCKMNIIDESRAEVKLLKPEAMIANGQTAVFYKGERLVGGGFIESSV